MSLTNIKKMQSERGFTIVELLIVVVIIGILAAIIIVAYTGITNRAKQSAAAGTAASMQKKTEAYYAETGSFPTQTSNYTGTTTASYYVNVCTNCATCSSGQVCFKLQAAGAVVAGDGTNAINYATCTTGYAIQYYDAVASGTKQIFGGGATAALWPGSCTIVAS